MGELAVVCADMEFECLYLARIGQPVISCAVSALAQVVANWNGACGRRLVRLIGYLTFTSGHRQFGHVGDKASERKLGLFQDADFAGYMAVSKSVSGGKLCIACLVIILVYPFSGDHATDRSQKSRM